MKITVGELRQVIKEEVMRDMYYEHARRTGGRLDEAGFKDWMKGVGKKISDATGRGLDAVGRGVKNMEDKYIGGLERGIDKAMDAGRKAVGRATDKQQRAIKSAKEQNSQLHDDVLAAVKKEFPKVNPDKIKDDLTISNILHRPLLVTLKLLKRAKIAERNCESMSAVTMPERYFADVSDVENELRSYLNSKYESDILWYENRHIWDMPSDLGIQESETGIKTLMEKNKSLSQQVLGMLNSYENRMRQSSLTRENPKK